MEKLDNQLGYCWKWLIFEIVLKIITVRSTKYIFLNYS